MDFDTSLCWDCSLVYWSISNFTVYWVPTSQAQGRILCSQPQTGLPLTIKMTNLPCHLSQTWGLRSLGKWYSCPASGDKGPRRNRGLFPHLCVCVYFTGLPHSSAASGPSDSSLMCFLCPGLLRAGVVLSEFFWLTDAPVEGSTFQVSSCHRRQAQEARANQAFPSPFS